jgi:hypothetical protein
VVLGEVFRCLDVVPLEFGRRIHCEIMRDFRSYIKDNRGTSVVLAFWLIWQVSARQGSRTLASKALPELLVNSALAISDIRCYI